MLRSRSAVWRSVAVAGAPRSGWNATSQAPSTVASFVSTGFGDGPRRRRRPACGTRRRPRRSAARAQRHDRAVAVGDEVGRRLDGRRSRRARARGPCPSRGSVASTVSGAGVAVDDPVDVAVGEGAVDEGEARCRPWAWCTRSRAPPPSAASAWATVSFPKTFPLPGAAPHLVGDGVELRRIVGEARATRWAWGRRPTAPASARSRILRRTGSDMYRLLGSSASRR